MTKKDFEIEIIPNELVLELAFEIPAENIDKKIEVLTNYFVKIRQSQKYLAAVLDLKFNEQLAFMHWQAEMYDKSAIHYEYLLVKLPYQLAPNSFSMAAFMVIRCYRRSNNFIDAYRWSEKLLTRSEEFTAFESLDILKEYIDLLEDSNGEFNRKFEPIIERIIFELGFPVRMSDFPNRDVKTIFQLNRKWNLSFPGRKLEYKEDRLLWERYIDECEINWYKSKAQEILLTLIKK